MADVLIVACWFMMWEIEITDARTGDVEFQEDLVSILLSGLRQRGRFDGGASHMCPNRHKRAQLCSFSGHKVVASYPMRPTEDDMAAVMFSLLVSFAGQVRGNTTESNMQSHLTLARTPQCLWSFV